jgi:transcriptional regulator EpsA
MALHTDMPSSDELWTVIRGSFAINKHVEFFNWLQNEVSCFLPHDVLVAVWGDFASGRLNYDVASNIPEIRTQKVISGCDVDPMMRDLYRRWLSGGEQWYVLDGLPLDGGTGQPNSCIDALENMRSALVHGIRDRRGNHDCMYVFFDRELLIEIDDAILEILVPQIDAVLRRVECLEPVIPDSIGLGGIMDDISDREREIMNWVQFGKTNQEIGMILNISHNTVKNHLKRIFQKMNVTSRAQAVAKFRGAREPA